MTEVSGVATGGAAAAAGMRGPVGEAPDAGGDLTGKGKFSDIFQGLGGEGSESDSAAGDPVTSAKEAGGPPVAVRHGRAGFHIAGADFERRFARADEAEQAPVDMPAEEKPVRRTERRHGPAKDDVSAKAELADPAGGEAAAPPIPVNPDIVPSLAAIATGAAVAARTVAGQAAPAAGAVAGIADAAEDAGSEPVEVPVTVLGRETHFVPARPRSAHGSAPAATSAAATRPTPGAGDKAQPAAVAGSDEAAPRADDAAVAMPAPDDAANDGGATIDDGVPSPDRGGHGSPDKVSAPAKSEPAAATARSDAPAAPVAPSLPGPVIERLAGAISSAAADAAPASPVATPEGSVDAPAREVVKVLTVRLDPPEYGSVAVRMTLQGSDLSLQLRADRASTADSLHRDREKLADALRADGFRTDPLMIDTRRDVTVARSDTTQTNAGGANANPGGTLSGQAGNDGQPSRGQAQTYPERPESKANDGAPPSDPGAGVLYV